MKCFLINLEAETARRAAVEAAFAAAPHAGWELVPVRAVTRAQAAEVPGALSGGEKGCLLSHRQVIAAALDDDAPIWIVEDDVAFGPHSFAAADAALAQARDWDLLFTEVAVPDPPDMLKLAASWPARPDDFRLIDLRALTFAGSTSYLLSGQGKRRLAEALAGLETLDRPYDLMLRDLCHAGALAGRVIFPFVTSISAHADASQIRDANLPLPDAIWNTFRRLMYVDRDVDACRASAEQLFAGLGDEPARVVGQLVAARLSADYQRDRR
jgi:GR25 family glycosyltransferase involved in LPS biosynthesis